jgi:hypothetical protein
MKLSEFATTLVAENQFIKASFGGFAGSGKTRTATEFIIGCYKRINKGKAVLIIDNEKGSRFLIPIFRNAGIQVILKETVTLADVLHAFDYVENGEVDFLFIDSLTKVWYKFVRDYRSNHNNRKLTLNDWGSIIPEWQEKFADRFVQLKGSCVFTGRGGYTYDLEEVEENGKTRKQFVKSGVKMKISGETAFEPDLNVWMEQQQNIEDDGKISVWREAQVMKDRSGLIDGKTFRNPTFKDFEPVVSFIMDCQVGDVKKTSDDTNLAPTDDYGWQARKAERDIENEKIKAMFDARKFSTGAEDKALKMAILKKIFNTTSATEIERMPVDTLRDYRLNLEMLFHDWDLLNDFDEKTKHINNFKPPFLMIVEEGKQTINT